MEDLLNLGHMLSIHARLSPGLTGAGDLDRSISLATSNDCVCRLAGTLLDPSRKNFDQDPCRIRRVIHLASTNPSHHDARTARGSSRAASSQPSHEAVPSDAKPSPAWGVSDLQSLAAWDDAEREWRVLPEVFRNGDVAV
jgi:hypothetical protein